MAYQEYSINAITDIPAIVSAFASSLGWNVPDTNTLRHPNYEGAGPGGLAFTLTADIDGLNHSLRWTCVTPPYNTKSAVLRSPIFSTAAAPNVGVTQTPTKLFLISRLDPEPYIAIVVEYGYNLYRHLYFGFMEKIGNYTGGEVIASSNGNVGQTVSSTRFWYDDGGASYSGCHYLFRRYNNVWTQDASGGVHVEHADNANKWRHFRRSATITASENWGVAFDGTDALGGFGDSFNDLYVAKGKNALAGASVLTPINLLVSQPVTGDARFTPIGCPTGVRMINIEELEAQSVAEVGGETWYVFAAHRKTDDLYTRGPTTTYRYPVSESSYYLGYAYRGD